LLGWILAGIIGLIILLVIALQFPATQRFLTSQGEQYLSNELQTRVEIGEVNVAFPKSIVLKDFYIEDRQQDTLLYSHRLAVDIDMFALFSQKIQVNRIEWENVRANIYRTLPDTTFNYQFILDTFAADEEPEEQEEGEWEFSLGEIHFNDIRLSYLDELEGTDLNTRIGTFNLEMKELDLEREIYHIGLVELFNTDLQLTQSKPLPEEEPVEVNYLVQVDRVNLNNININYEDQVNEQDLDVNLGELGIDNAQIDMGNQDIEINSIRLNNSVLAFIMHAETPEEPTEEFEEVPGYTFQLHELALDNNELKYENRTEPRQPQGMDFNYLHFADFDARVENIYFQPDTIGANLKHLSMIEQSGFRIEDFQTQLRVNSTQARLENLELRTGVSYFAQQLVIHYPSLEAIGEDMSQLVLSMDLNSRIGFRDLFYFQPELAQTPPFAGNPNGFINANLRLRGPVDDLRIPHANMDLMGQVHMSASGHITGLPEAEQAFYNFTFHEITTSAQGINALAPAGTIPEDINLPKDIRLTGNFKGRMDDFRTNIEAFTTLGNMAGNFHLREVNNIQHYDGTLSIQNLDLGAIMNQPETLGTFTLSAQLDGQGLDMETIQTNIQASMEKGEIMGYEYHDMVLRGRLQQQEFTGHVNLDDPNLRFTFDGLVNMTDEENPEFDFTFNLEQANLQAINLSEDSLHLSMMFTADLEGADINTIEGNFGFKDVDIMRNGQAYHVDSLMFAAIRNGEETDIRIDSDLFTAFLRGNILFTEIGDVVTKHINQYIDLHQEEELAEDPVHQHFDFGMQIHQTELLTQLLIPDLDTLELGEIRGSYDSRAMSLNVHMLFPRTVYNDMVIDSVRLDIGSDENKLEYIFSINAFETDAISIQNMELLGNVANDSIRSRLQLRDEEGTRRYVLGGVLQSLDDAFRFTFLPQEMILNYESWFIPEDNFLEFGEKGFRAHNFSLERGFQRIAVKTPQTKDLRIDFSDFNLDVVSQMVERDTSLVRGILNGHFGLSQVEEDFLFNTNLRVENFSFQQDTVGNIVLEAFNPTPERYNAKLEVSSKDNLAVAEGFYLMPTNGDEPSFGLNLNIVQIDLSTLDQLAGDEITEMEGKVFGKIRAWGTIDAPEVRGSLTFEKAAFNIATADAKYRLENERVTFDNEGIRFRNFRIQDMEGNAGTINGQVFTHDYSNFRFSLDVRTANFHLLSAPRRQDQLYHGDLFLDSNIKIRGDINHPIVDAFINIRPKTNLTLAVADQQAEVAEKAGIVEFVDKSAIRENGIDPREELREVTQTEITGLTLNAVINTDPEARFTVLIDPTGNDSLSIRGTANLNLTLDPSGNMTLTGTYEIAQGFYQLAFMNVVNRRFDIAPGSTIAWTGDPLDATMNIRAIYSVRTAPVNLMAGMVSDERALSEFRQAMPFKVYLNLEGELMTPEISFGLDVPEEHRNVAGGRVYSRVEQLNQEHEEAELNKQVFALLVLGNFIQDDPFAGSGEGGGTTAAARRSVSNLLTQQLNRLSDRYIQGIDLNIGVQSYEDQVADEGRTELQIGVGRQFFDERLSVQVGGHVDIEGGRARQEQRLSDIAGNISLEYSITPDGRIRLRGFRQQTFDTYIEGELIETGIGLIFSRDYNRFNELFRRPQDVAQEEAEIPDEVEVEEESIPQEQDMARPVEEPIQGDEEVHENTTIDDDQQALPEN
jgi:translocation and assembly module TamB